VKPRYGMLRLLVLAGCVPLLLRGPRLATVGAHTEDCTQISTTPSQGNCPSGCTSTKYTYYALIGGTGFQYADEVPAPCTPSTCTQPFALGPPGIECPQCCWGDGDKCDPQGCYGENPCCNSCYEGHCCTGSGLLCNVYSVCCDPAQYCLSGFCQSCAWVGQGCNTFASNCCDPGAQCQYGTCCFPPGMDCPGGTGCCPGSHCQNGTCECNIRAPQGEGLLRAFWL
jgi:hypothetical protein